MTPKSIRSLSAQIKDKLIQQTLERRMQQASAQPPAAGCREVPH